MSTIERVTITGGAGYLGSCLTRALLSQGVTVRVVDSLLHGAESLAALRNRPNLELIVGDEGDLRRETARRAAVEGADTVIHLAALVGEAACHRDPEATRATNLDGSLQLFAAAARSRVRHFLFASTCSNYGRGDAHHPFTEDSPLTPLSLYAETKVEAEKGFLRSRGGPRITVARFATLFGLSPRPRLDLTVNDFTAVLSQGQALEVYDPDSWRPYLHVADAARALVTLWERAREKGPRAPEVWNVGCSELNFRKRDIATRAHQIVGRGEIVETSGRRDPRDYRVSFERLEGATGFRPERSLDDGIREVRDALLERRITEPGAPRYRN